MANTFSLLDVVNNGVSALSAQVTARYYGGAGAQPNSAAALRLRDQLFAQYPFTEEAKAWLRANTSVVLKDSGSQNGGGYWFSLPKLVFLYTGQMEAALHEHSHAWWEFHGHRLPAADEIIDALKKLADEPDPAYSAVKGLAHDYVFGIHTETRDWIGMVIPHNDHEIFAGLASGTMGDMKKLPLYMRHFYQGLFIMPT